MFFGLMLFLTMLFVKHFLVDFVLRTDAQVASKGKYGDFQGLMHSVYHGIGTMVVLFLFFGFNPIIMLWLGAFDFLLHYHIDFAKMRFGERDITKKAFWVQLGLDQLAHAITYFAMVVLLFS